MTDIHIIIQRWFKPGHGAAFDNLISRTQRTVLEDAIAQAEKGFNGTTIERIESSPKQYINIWVAVDEDCPDELAKSRNANVAIGIWSSEELTKERIESLRQKALTITRRGGYPPETFGIQTPSALSSKNILIGISLILILCVLGFGLCSRFKSSEETTENNHVVQNKPDITQPPEGSEEDDSGKSATPEESKSPAVIPSSNDPASEEPASDTPEIVENAQDNSEQSTEQVTPIEPPASTALIPVTPPVPEPPVIVLPQKPKSADWTQFNADNNDIGTINAKLKVSSSLKYNLDNNINVYQHKQLNCLIEYLNGVINTINNSIESKTISLNHPDHGFLSQFPKKKIDFLPAQPTEEEIRNKYAEIKDAFRIEKMSSLIERLDYNSYYEDKSFSIDGTAEISKELHDMIFSLSLNNDVNNEQTKNAQVLFNLLKQWDVKGIFEDDCQKRPWFIVASFFNYLNTIRESLKSGNIDTVPLPKEPMNVGKAKDILQNKGGIIQELSELMPPSEYKSDSDLKSFLKEFMPYWRLKLRLWKKQVHSDCPSTFNTLLEEYNVQY